MKNKTEIKDLIKKRLSEAKNYISVELNPNDPKLAEQISLGDEWDNPQLLSRAMDMHPTWQARWSSLLKDLMRERDKRKAKYDVWEANKKKDIRESLIEKMSDEGLTRKQSIEKVTNTMVENEFNSKYNEKNINYRKYKDPLNEITEQLDNVQIIVDAFKARKDLLVVMGYIVKSMIDSNLLIFKQKKGKK